MQAKSSVYDDKTRTFHCKNIVNPAPNPQKGTIRPGERVPTRDLLRKVRASPGFRFGAGASRLG